MNARRLTPAKRDMVVVAGEWLEGAGPVHHAEWALGRIKRAGSAQQTQTTNGGGKEPPRREGRRRPALIAAHLSSSPRATSSPDKTSSTTPRHLRVSDPPSTTRIKDPHARSHFISSPSGSIQEALAVSSYQCRCRDVSAAALCAQGLLHDQAQRMLIPLGSTH